MKNKTMLVTAILILLSLGSSLLTLSCSNPNKEKQLYTCPMHTDYVVDKPGDCPICGMRLVKVEKTQSPVPVEKGQEDMYRIEKDAADMGRTTVNISPEKQQLIGVKTDTVAYRELGSSIMTVGVVTYDPELYYAQQEYITAFKNTSGGGATGRAAAGILESAKIKLKSLGLTNEQISRLESMDEANKSLLITEGGDTVWVYARVYQDDLGSVKRGQSADIMSTSTGKKIFRGIVTSIDPVLNPETRSSRVRIQVENPGSLLRTEMYVDVRIKSTEGRFLSIPVEAIIDTGTRQIAFIAKEDGYFEPRLVVLGNKKEDFYVVQAGLKEGERVVVNANFLVDSESQLKAALSNMSGGGHKH